MGAAMKFHGEGKHVIVTVLAMVGLFAVIHTHSYMRHHQASAEVQNEISAAPEESKESLLQTASAEAVEEDNGDEDDKESLSSFLHLKFIPKKQQRAIKRESRH